MKIARLFSVFAALAAAFLLTLPVSAGSAVMKIPFSFEVGGKILPAGEYKFTCPSGETLMKVVDSKGNATLAFVRADNPRGQSSKAVFDKSSGTAKLSSIVIYGQSGYRSLLLR